MSTLTITVDEPTLARLRAKAEAQGTTPEAVAAAELSRPARKSDTDPLAASPALIIHSPRADETDPLLKLAGMFSSGVPDAFTHHDEYLGQALYDEMRGRGEKPDVR